MTQSLSFDGFSAIYDQTRASEPACFEESLDWLSQRFPHDKFNSVLEPGVGTGRVAKQLVKRGYRVTGVDLSLEMLELCFENDAATSSLNCLVGDAAKLPFPAASFDIAVAAHLFYFITNWGMALEEMLRVLRPDGSLILMSTGYGSEVPEMNERYKTLARQQGFVFPTYGVTGTQEVVDYAKSIGCSTERVEQPAWKWINAISGPDALGFMRNRAYLFLRDVPNELHEKVIASLSSEYDRRDCVFMVENKIYFILVAKPA